MKLEYRHPIYNGKEDKNFWNVFVDGQTFIAKIGKGRTGKLEFFKNLQGEYSVLRKVIIRDIEKLENILEKNDIYSKIEEVSKQIVRSEKSGKSEKGKEAEKGEKGEKAEKSEKRKKLSETLVNHELWEVKFLGDEEILSRNFFKKIGKKKCEAIYNDLIKLL